MPSFPKHVMKVARTYRQKDERSFPAKLLPPSPPTTIHSTPFLPWYRQPQAASRSVLISWRNPSRARSCWFLVSQVGYPSPITVGFGVKGEVFFACSINLYCMRHTAIIWCLKIGSQCGITVVNEIVFGYKFNSFMLFFSSLFPSSWAWFLKVNAAPLENPF